MGKEMGIGWFDGGKGRIEVIKGINKYLYKLIAKRYCKPKIYISITMRE